MGITIETVKTIYKAADMVRKYMNAMEFQKKNYVLVGIPQKKTKREDEPITNAELLYIHTNGSPKNHIPKRPVIEPALRDDRKRISSMLKNSMDTFLDAGEEAALKELEKVGIRAQKVSRGWFVNPNNHWPPNSPAVEAAKRKKKATDPKPLIDTGELRKSITYVLVKDGERND